MAESHGAPVPLAEVWRGGILECVHYGHAVICDSAGQIMEAWGDPDQVILPRSSCKMIQALPLVESGAADAFHLADPHLALACASHQGAGIHTSSVEAWLSDIGLREQDMRCGVHAPWDKSTRADLIKTDDSPCQFHNNCSGKHAGFLTFNTHLGLGSEYHEIDHPLQVAIKAAVEDVTNLESLGYGIDGCSAPNFATTVHGLARAMAFFAAADVDSGSMRVRAAARLRDAMRAYPDLVAGEGRACTELMEAMNGQVAIKTGADGVYTAIIPAMKIGVALKVTDGGTRGSECAIAALLVHLGVLDANHPATLKRMNAPQYNSNKIETGIIRPAAGFC